MPSERFEMISAGSLDNSGDIFEEDKNSLSHNKLFSIESFFNGPCTGDSTEDHISSSQSSSNLIVRQQSTAAKTEDCSFWLQSNNLELPYVKFNSEHLD
jgi:hypothetical protein